MSMYERVDVLTPGGVVTIDLTQSIEDDLVDEVETTGEALFGVDKAIKGRTSLTTPEGGRVLIQPEAVLALTYRRIA